jgi:hypothetical protein
VSYRDKREKLAITGFDTGEEYIPNSALDAIATLLSLFRAASVRTQGQVEMITKASQDPSTFFKVHISVVGSSSRIWRGARGAAVQRERNMQLSQQRAELVAEQLKSRLSDCAAVLLDNVSGQGPCVVVPDTRGGTPQPVSGEEQAGELWRREWEKWETENYDRDHTPTVAEKKAKIQELDARYSKSSNDPLARRVDVEIWYEAKEIFGRQPAQTPADAPRPSREPHPGEDNLPDATVPDATIQ